MHEKFLKVGTLTLLQIVIVGNLQILPPIALYNLSLPLLFVLAALCFYLPCVLMVAELATTHPQTGGAYIWCQKAFGQKAGFFTVALLWISNVLWYPSIFSLLAANLAYIFDPALASNKTFILSFSLGIFWLITLLNCFGIRFSAKISTICCVIGIIMPMLLIIASAVVWWLKGNPLALSYETPEPSYLISLVVSLFGIEITAVHAGNVVNPKRDYPKSLLTSSIAIITLLLLAALSIAAIIPQESLSVMTGLLDALVRFFSEMGLSKWLFFVLLLVFLGNVGSLTAWMLGSTRGMFVAAQNNHVASFLQKTNRKEAPVGVLIFEAIIFTLATSVFLLFTDVSSTFWLLLAIASQITLIYYILLFSSAIRLRYLPQETQGFIIPGGKVAIWLLMGIGICTSLAAIWSGFLAPDNLSEDEVFSFHIVMTTGLIIALLLPAAFFACRSKGETQ